MFVLEIIFLPPGAYLMSWGAQASNCFSGLGFFSRTVVLFFLMYFETTGCQAL